MCSLYFTLLPFSAKRTKIEKPIVVLLAEKIADLPPFSAKRTTIDSQ